MTSIKHVGKHCGFFFKGIGFAGLTGLNSIGDSMKVVNRYAPDVNCIGVGGGPVGMLANEAPAQVDDYAATMHSAHKTGEYFKRTFSHCR
jgi:hypothetical protein